MTAQWAENEHSLNFNDLSTKWCVLIKCVLCYIGQQVAKPTSLQFFPYPVVLINTTLFHLINIYLKFISCQMSPSYCWFKMNRLTDPRHWKLSQSQSLVSSPQNVFGNNPTNWLTTKTKIIKIIISRSHLKKKKLKKLKQTTCHNYWHPHIA